LNDSEGYESIKDSETPSFPSGHTAIAYFISGILSNLYPEFKDDFKTIAELTGLSRMENGVHYPSDISYGQLIGELICDFYLADKTGHKDYSFETSNADHIDFSNHLRTLSYDYYPGMPKESAISAYVGDFANFLHRTNEIENYMLSYNECLKAAYDCIAGYPTSYITKNKHIASHIDGLVQSFKSHPIDSFYKIIDIHKKFNPGVIEKGNPGSIRNYKHYSKSGDQFADPEKIIKYLKNIDKTGNPYVKHIIFEWIHPFTDGNGRSGRIMLAADVNYRFDHVNQFIDKKYIQRIINFIKNYDIKEILDD
jgi:hypothetical protein